MKRIFTIITILISLSLIGIILIQVSWINNMISLRVEQIKHNVDESTKMVAGELAQHKGSYASGTQKKKGLLSDPFGFDIFKPTTIGQSFDANEIKGKIQAAFLKHKLKNIPFEFGIATFPPDGSYFFEKMTPDIIEALADTVNNYSYNEQLVALTGTAGENLTNIEALFVVVPDVKAYAIKSLRWRIVVSFLFTLIILAAFYLTVRTMLRQKKLGEIKNDFINNMTHEFKTPIATISLAVDAMRNEKVINDKEKMGYFSGIIKEENQRMNRQVETILRASLLEKQEVELSLKPVNVHHIISEVVENFALQLHDKNGKASLMLNAANDLINADEVHFSNLVNNLMENAVKYSKDNVSPEIKLTTHSDERNFILHIEDNGIGMSRETLKRIFEKFYRAHTGNVHNVKGFGLGLSYVKTMVSAHGGTIKAESALGKGSSFFVAFPLKKL
ncbi:MAG: HAMP domain-containing histidine kinase [Chitinophagaceae bacterium]|nr:HAMP domain-containing histidine kinase [Chitinophagaceae bacterium]